MPLARDVVKDLAVEHGACVRPIQLRRTDLTTGQVEPVLVPCGHTLASVCPSCAERAKTLRAAQCREGWHLDQEPVIEPDKPTDDQKWLIETRADAQAARDADEAHGDDTTEWDSELVDLDEQINQAWMRGNVLPKRPERRHRSTRRRQDAPPLPKRAVDPARSARPTPARGPGARRHRRPRPAIARGPVRRPLRRPGRPGRVEGRKPLHRLRHQVPDQTRRRLPPRRDRRPGPPRRTPRRLTALRTVLADLRQLAPLRHPAQEPQAPTCAPARARAKPIAASTSATPAAACSSPASGPARPSPITAPTARTGSRRRSAFRQPTRPATPGNPSILAMKTTCRPGGDCCTSSPTASAGNRHSTRREDADDQEMAGGPAR